MTDQDQLHPTGDTGVVIVPPHDICAFANHYRRLYMPEEMDKIPPHISVAGPLMPYEQLVDALPRLRAAISSHPETRMSLREFAVFPDAGVLYLRPAYPERIIALYRSILAEFPDYPAYGGQYGDDLVPHMTVGLFTDRAQMQAAYEELSAMKLYLGWVMESLTVVYKGADDRWNALEEIPLLGRQLDW
ncbi:MAG TPA: 2'-5' RNA ligase family protein [Chloroflexia bacterium]|nr:2'-5' RNA ligase family protein [Chloroflexia bacterium]